MPDHIPYDQPSPFDWVIQRMLAEASGLGPTQIYLPLYIRDECKGWHEFTPDLDAELSDWYVTPNGEIVQRSEWYGTTGWEMR